MKIEDSDYLPEKIKKELYEEFENKICVECGAAMPKFVSINNGILICEQCANLHISLGWDVSYVRNIEHEWDPYLLSYMQLGGNFKYKQFRLKYNIESIPLEQRYFLKISNFYRLDVRNII